MANRIVHGDDLIREEDTSTFRGSCEPNQHAPNSWAKTRGHNLRQGLVKIQDDSDSPHLQGQRAEHLKIRQGVDVNDLERSESMEPQKLNRREDEKQSVLERIANTTTSTSAQRNPRDPSPVDRFEARLVLAAKADDFNVIPRTSERINFSTDTRIRRKVGIRHVADPHRTAAAVTMTATQTSASNAQITRTISHSRSRFHRMTA